MIYVSRRDLRDRSLLACGVYTFPRFHHFPLLLDMRVSTPAKVSDHIVPVETVSMEVFTMVKSVLIADDHTLVRQAICFLFDTQLDFEVCGDAENGKEAVEMAQVLHPDLIVLDLLMPVMDGLEATHALRRSVPETPIVVLSESSHLLSEHQAHARGISALVSKREPVSVLLDKARATLHCAADVGAVFASDSSTPT